MAEEPAADPFADDGESRLGEGTRVFGPEQRIRQDWNAGDTLSSAPEDWRETPASSRITRYRFDGGNYQIHIEFRKGGDQYVYRDVPRQVYHAMNRAVSKGRFVNRVLNQYVYGRADGAW